MFMEIFLIVKDLELVDKFSFATTFTKMQTSVCIAISINQLFSEFLVWLLVMVRESIFVKAPSNKLWAFEEDGKMVLKKYISLISFHFIIG